MKQLMMIDAMSISNKKLHELYLLNNSSCEQVFELLPKYTIKEDGSIEVAKYYLYYVSSTPDTITTNENYLLFDIKYQDSLLEFETNNGDLEEVIENNFKPELFKNFNIPSYDSWCETFCHEYIKLVFNVWYESYYDDYNGVNESDSYTELIGYLDKELNLIEV